MILGQTVLVDQVHEVQSLQVELLSLVGDAKSKIADANVLISIDYDLVIFSIDGFLNASELFPELERDVIVLLGSLKDSQVCDGLFKEGVSSAAFHILQLLLHHIAKDSLGLFCA